jgi:copper chaperone CopZ
MDIEFTVTGMSCGHCEVAVRAEVDRLVGVERVQVDAGSGRLVVTSSATVDAAAVLAAVAEAGYAAEPVR